MPNALLLIAHTIPLVVPDDETEGDDPGKPKESADCELNMVLNVELPELKANAFSEPEPAKYGENED